MPVAGRKPKEGPKRNQMPAAHDWVEVEDRPFRGAPLVAFPSKRRVEVGGRVSMVEWQPLTKLWWKTIKAMPHCTIWTPADWLFAVATATIADDVFRSASTAAAGELRQREKILGVTLDSRRDLRIRYVKRLAAPLTAVVVPSAVVSIDERRKRSLSDAT